MYLDSVSELLVKRYFLRFSSTFEPKYRSVFISFIETRAVALLVALTQLWKKLTPSKIFIFFFETIDKGHFDYSSGVTVNKDSLDLKL